MNDTQRPRHSRGYDELRERRTLPQHETRGKHSADRVVVPDPPAPPGAPDLDDVVDYTDLLRESIRVIALGRQLYNGGPS